MLFHTELLYLLKITDKNKIMILNGKAKEEFFNWLDNQGVNGIDISNWEFEKFHLLSNVSQNALIIEWFDGIKHPKIEIVRIIWNTWSNSTLSYKEALTEVIKKANEIYNSTL